MVWPVNPKEVREDQANGNENSQHPNSQESPNAPSVM